MTVVAPPDQPALSASANGAEVDASGTCTIGDTVSLRADGSPIAGGSVLCVDGTWALTVTLASGRHTVTAVQTEPVFGLESTSRSVRVTISTSPPGWWW